MGTCLGKKCNTKHNAVGPAPDDHKSRSKSSKKASVSEPSGVTSADVEKQLKEGHYENSKVAKGGVAFVLDPKEGDQNRMPTRLADRLDGASSPTVSNGEIQYTSTEKELLAELYRKDILREKREKACRDVKINDAARRRAARSLLPAAENI